MKKLLLLLVGVLTAYISQATDFQVGKTYYIDISNVSTWIFDDNRGLYVWDGGKNLETTKVANNIYSWKQESSGKSTICVKRATSKDAVSSDNWWNVSNPTSNCVKLNKDNDSSSWYGTDYNAPTDWATTALYIRGLGGKWGVSDATPLTYTNGKFVGTVGSISSGSTFKIGSGEAASWTHSWNFSAVALSGNAASKLVDDGTNDHNYKANADLSNVTFTFDPTASPKPTLDVTEGGSGIVTPTGWSYFVVGSFTSDGNDVPMRLNSTKEPGQDRYSTILECLNKVDGWGSIVFYGVYTDENGVETERKYFSKGSKDFYGAESYIFSTNHEADVRIDISSLDEAKKYKFTLDAAQNYFWVTEDNVEHTGYYLSGDINVWSDLFSRNTSNVLRDNQHNKNYGYFSGEGSDNGGYFYLQDDPNNPWVRFKSKEEMQNVWRFDYVGNGPEGTTGSNWYRLNLKAKGAADLKGNLGRLGGQFKILGEYEYDGKKVANLEQTDQCYGVSANTNGDDYIDDNELKEYWKKVIKLEETFTAGSKNGGQNFMLDNTVIEDAVIWFQPRGSECDVRIYGKANDLYVYYVNEGLTESEANGFAGPKVYVNVSEQANNFPHVDPFRGYTIKNGSESSVSTTVAGYYDFSWERLPEGAEYNPHGEGGGHSAIHFNNVWRKKIPASIIHRTPMSYLTSVKPYEAPVGQWFPAVRIDCEDIWFIENKAKKINVFLRFADEGVQNSTATQVYFNAWLDQYDADGSRMADPLYLLDEMSKGKMTKISKKSLGETEFNLLVDDKHRTENGKDLSWFMAPADIITPDIANAGYAMFITAYGGEYPTDFHNGSLGDRQSVALNGTDLYYVVGGSSSRVGMLYSHLKGTFVAGDADEIQINAEFFARGHNVFKTNELNTTIGSEVDYRFSVSKVNENGVREELLPNAERWYDEPYYNWDVRDYDPGLYVVTVTVRKLVNGTYEYYSSNDIYPIFRQR